MIRLNFIEVIVFYEVPQIFIATDIFDTKYLCLLYPHDDELCYKYLAVRISEKRLNLFKGQIIDLRNTAPAHTAASGFSARWS